VETGSLEPVLAILRHPDRLRRAWMALDGSTARPWRGNSFAPQISYGRHRGPAPPSTHPAAVLMALLPSPTNQHQGQWTIPLTLRPATMAEHAGQVSFPGGRCQAGESHEQAACREYTEELGCPNERIELIGSLPSMYVYASRHRVVPLLGLGGDLPVMRPNPDEVSEVLFLPLEHLLGLRPLVRKIQRGAMLIETPGFWLEGHWVWGATAMMLEDLKIRLVRIARSWGAFEN